ncbi:MAG: hypothetical protein ABI729_00915, partial [Chitinophagales bacterium]
MNALSLPALGNIAIAISALGCYYGLLFSSRIKKMINCKSESVGSRSWILYERLSGAIILGCVPAALLLVLSPITISTSKLFEIPIENFYLVPVSCTIILVINFFATRKARNRKGYPLFRAEVWNASSLFFNQSTWAVYLFAYEFLFRGVLLSAT